MESLSVFHRILIFLEDGEEVVLPDLKLLGPSRIVNGALGRLEALGYISRLQGKSGDKFRLSDAGDSYLAKELSFLPDKPMKSLWVTTFHIDEHHRTMRYRIKTKLAELGFTPLDSGVWFTSFQPQVAEFTTFMTKTCPNIEVISFETATKIASSVLTSRLMEQRYRSLFRECSRVTSGPNRRFEAKCRLFELSQITKHDHHLHTHRHEKRWAGNEAKKWVTTLRQIINTTP